MPIPTTLITDIQNAVPAGMNSLMVEATDGGRLACRRHSVSDIKECHKHLKTTPVVRVVVNRVTEATDAYYGYY